MIFAIIGIALVAFIGFGLYKASGLKSIQIIKTVTIKGTNQEVFDMVKNLNVTKFYEIGSGKVLTGLIKRIAPESELHNIGTAEDLLKYN